MTGIPTTLPRSYDSSLLKDIVAAEKLLGDGVQDVGVCLKDGVHHTWGECPYTPTIDGIMPWSGVELVGWRPSEVFRREQCTACAAGLRAGGGTAVWLRSQLAPASALLLWKQRRSSAGHALRRCLPTGLLPEPQTRRLLNMLPSASELPPGLLALIPRSTATLAAEDLMERGVHESGGMTLISVPRKHKKQVEEDVIAGTGASWIGEVSASEANVHTARICLKLARNPAISRKDLWALAVGLS